MRGNCLLLCLLLIAVGATAKAATLGGWTPIKDLRDSHVMEIAKFAVSEYNKRSNGNLSLGSVVKGETQVVNGINYRLVLVVKDNKDQKMKYVAVIFEKPQQNVKNLRSFKPA